MKIDDKIKQGRQHQGGRGAMVSSLFCVAKKRETKIKKKGFQNRNY